MSFTQGVIITLLGFTGVSVVLFTLDRWVFSSPGERSRGLRALFANPFLKFGAVLLLVVIVVGEYTGNVAWLVVGSIAATVAGADFVLLFTAILRGNKTFIQEFFQTERARIEQLAQRSAQLFREAAETRSGIQGGSGRTQAPDRDVVEEAMREMSGRINILWVDDKPKGNEKEVSAFREMGFGVDMRTTNDGARRAYLQKRYDLIISDIDRAPAESSTAGLALPGILEAADPDRPIPPFIYYVHKVDEAITDLGHPVVNTPWDLMDAVTDAVA